MADFIDSTQQITINVIIPEGFATIANLVYPSEATVGETVNVTFDLENTGGYEDILFAQISGTLIGATPTELFRGAVPTSSSQPVLYSFVMPPNAVTLTIDVGHEE